MKAIELRALGTRYTQLINHLENEDQNAKKLPLIVEAMECQQQMAALTQGEARKRHELECSRLLQLAELLQKQQQSPTLARKKVEPISKASDSKKSSSESTAPTVAQTNEYGMQDFDVEKYHWGSEKCPEKIPETVLEELAVSSAPARQILQTLKIPSKIKGLPEEEQRHYARLLGANNFLLYGPPGTGKSFLMGAVARFITDYCEDSAFFAIKSSALSAGLQGLPSKRLIALLEAATKYKNAIVMIDECELLFARRDADDSKTDEELTQTLMQYMSGASGSMSVSIWGATNYPWRIDRAMLDRLEYKIGIPLPSKEDIRDYLRKQADLAYISPSSNSQELIDRILDHLEHASFRDVNNLLEKIQLLSLHEHPAKLTAEQILQIAAGVNIRYDREYVNRVMDPQKWEENYHE